MSTLDGFGKYEGSIFKCSMYFSSFFLLIKTLSMVILHQSI